MDSKDIAFVHNYYAFYLIELMINCTLCIKY